MMNKESSMSVATDIAWKFPEDKLPFVDHLSQFLMFSSVVEFL